MKLIPFFGATALAVGLFLIGSPRSVLDKHVAGLQEAKSLEMTFTVQKLPAPGVEYKLTYAKPNMILIDGPDSLIESDGTTIWELDKKDNTFTESLAAKPDLLKKTSTAELLAWAAFFNPDTFKSAANIGGGTARIVKSNPVTEVSFDLGDRKVTLYSDDKLGVARGFSVTTGSGTTLVMASKIALGADSVATGKFAFVAPAGATKWEGPKPGEFTYVANIEPLFRNRCLGCHGGGRMSGGYSVSSYQTTMQAGITPGNGAGSHLYQLLTGQAQPRMPRNGAPFTADELATVKGWIDAGAPEK